MKVEIMQTGFRIIPESPQDDAYLTHVLGCAKPGDLALAQVNALKAAKPGDPTMAVVITKMVNVVADTPRNIEQALASAQAQGLAQ